MKVVLVTQYLPLRTCAVNYTEAPDIHYCLLCELQVTSHPRPSREIDSPVRRRQTYSKRGKERGSVPNQNLWGRRNVAEARGMTMASFRLKQFARPWVSQAMRLLAAVEDVEKAVGEKPVPRVRVFERHSAPSPEGTKPRHTSCLSLLS